MIHPASPPRGVSCPSPPRSASPADPRASPATTPTSSSSTSCPSWYDGQLLLRVVYLSLDPYMRGRMSAAPSYAAPVEVGDVMVGGTVCVVEESRHPEYAAGDMVLSYSGWQTHAISDGSGLRRLDPSVVPVSTALGVLGMPGFTAYAGLLEIGRPQPGETVVVAAATGPVGSAVGQIAQVKGARAVGIAGGEAEAAGPARRVRLRRRAGPPLPHVRGRPGRGRPGRDRRLLRERQRAGRPRGVQADEPLRTGPGVRAGGRLQRRGGAPRARTGCRGS